MVMLYFLRMLADLGAYFAFGGTICSISGGGEKLMGALLLECAVYAFACLPKKRIFRLLLTLPILGAFFLPGLLLSDRIMLAPPTLYLFYLAFAGDNALSWNRHISLFKGFLSAYVPFAIITALLGAGEELLICSLPYALMMLASSVLLMRALRHDESIYRETRFLLINGIGVLLLAACALFMSTEAFRQGLETVFGTLYRYVVAPVLMLVMLLMGGIVAGIAWLLSRVKKEELEEFGEPLDVMFNSAEEILGLEEAQQASAVDPVWWLIIAALAVLVIVFFFFRWLTRRHESDVKLPGREERFQLEDSVVREKEPPRGSPVQKVRALYRRFLKLCEKQGTEFLPSTTTKDVEYDAQRFYPNQHTTTEMREIYLAARYAERAEKADVTKMKNLLSTLKKNGRESEQ